MLKIFDRFVDFLDKVARIIVTISLMAIIFCVFYGIVSRNAQNSWTWLEEFSRYAQVWFVSLGLGVTIRVGDLPATEILMKYLSEKGKRVLTILIQSLMFLFAISMLVYGAELMGHLIRTGQLSSNMEIPMWWAYLGLYSGFGLMAVFSGSALLHLCLDAQNG